MKKIITVFFAGIILISPVSVNAAEANIVDLDSNSMIEANHYLQEHSSFFEATVTSEIVDVNNEYDYQIETTISFPVEYHCEYLILPYENEKIGFYNFSYEEHDYAIHQEYDMATSDLFNAKNDTLSFPGDDAGQYLLTLSDSSTFSVWEGMFGSSIISHNGNNYSLNNAVVCQSKYTNMAKFSTLGHPSSEKFLVCRLYRRDFTNKIYEGKDPYIVTSVTEPISTDSLLNYISVSDNYDTNASSTLQIIDGNYQPENRTLSTYFLTLQAKDNSGNYVRQKVYIKTVDYTAPVITGKTDYIAHYGYKLQPLDSIKHSLKATDNYDGEISSFYIIEDNYTPNYRTVGKYTVIAGIKDSSNNEARVTCTFEVRDNLKPLVSVLSSLSVNVGSDLLTKEDIIAKFKCYDEYDKENISIQLEGYEAYAANYNVLGDYPMILSVTDLSGNCFKLDFKFSIVDQENPTIEITGDVKTIVVPAGQEVTEAELIQLIKNTNPNKDVLSIASLYFTSEEKQGDFDVLVTYEDGSVETYKLSIEGTNTKDSSNNMYIYFIAGASILTIGVALKLLLDKKRGTKSLTKRKK